MNAFPASSAPAFGFVSKCEFLRHFRFCDEEDSGLSDEEQERKGQKNRPKHTRKRIHQAKKNFL